MQRSLRPSRGVVPPAYPWEEREIAMREIAMKPVTEMDPPAGRRGHRHSWAGMTALVLTSVLGLLACSEDGVGPGEEEAKADVATYLATLPTWDEFSPRVEDSGPDTVVAATEVAPDTVDVQTIDEEGGVDTLYNSVYTCTETELSMTRNPREIVMYSPNVGVLWAGGLLQGKSHRAGNLESLPIRQRQPVKVSIPGIASGQNYRLVENPELATVNAAISEMVEGATLSEIPSPSSIDFRYTESYSEQQLALAMEISGRYMGFSAKANASFESNASETTITAHFVEKMFDVVVELPQTPADFFSAEFTQAELDRQTALGRIGPDNLPVFIHTITYGRMMTFSMTSTASSEEMRAALEAAYKNIGNGLEVKLDAKSKTILENARIAVTSHGGNAQATLDVIRTGDWSRYFTEAAPLSAAAPLSYVFQTLDGKPAGVTEATRYTVRDCTPQLSNAGLFDFEALQTVPLGISTTGLRTRMADVNGDGRTDIIWNSVSSAGNSWVVGLAAADGSFTMSGTGTHPVATPPVPWSYFETLVGDFDGDGLPDLAWGTRGSEGNHIYLATSNGDGTFATQDVVSGQGGSAAHSDWRAFAADADGDGRDDLLFNYLRYPYNYIVIATATDLDTSTDFILSTYQSHSTSGHWENYDGYVGDVNDDGRGDMVWSKRDTDVQIYLGTSDATPPTFSFSGPYPQVPGATFYQVPGATFVRDLNGDGRSDVVLAWSRPDELNRVLVNLGTTAGGLTYVGFYDPGFTNKLPMQVMAGDLNGDGRADLLWNELGGDNGNQLYVSLGRADGTYDVSTPTQIHTAERADWTQYAVHLADVNGDGREDVVWIHAMDQARIYVGLAR